MCKTCGGSKVVYKLFGSMMLTGPCPECNSKAKAKNEGEVRQYENINR